MIHVPSVFAAGSARSARSARSALSALALATSLCLPLSVQAVSLASPSGSNFADTDLPGTTSAARPELAGTVVADTLTTFSFQGISGTVQNRVVREDSAGTLDFYWKVNVDSDSSGLGVSAFRLIDFGLSNITDADWRLDGLGGTAPTVARVFNSSVLPTGAINFLMSAPFNQASTAGASSRFFFLHTASTDFAQTARFDLLSGGPQNLSATYATYAPAAVPEPSSLVLAVLGCTALALVRCRSHRG